MSDGESPWRSKSRLYQLYHEEGLSKSEIADRFGCSDTTINNWMNRRGVPTSRARDRPKFVRSLYVDEELTQEEIAKRLGCDQTTISRVLLENGVDTRDRGDYTQPSVAFTQTGYMMCRHRDGGGCDQRVAFQIHRLVAVAEFGLDAVEGKLVHHKNGHPADNRPDNLELVSRSDHTALHHEQRDILESYPS